MNDWKSALKDIKKSLAPTASKTNSSKPASHSQPQATRPVAIPTPPKAIQPVPVRGVAAAAPPARPGSGRLPSADERVENVVAKPLHKTARKPVAPVLPVKPQPGTTSTMANVSPALPVPAPPRPAGIPTSFRSIQRSVLLRQQRYRSPAAWVSRGLHTQHAVAAAIPKFMDIVIGLDFGTSYTKVAVGLMDHIYPVTWDGVSATPDVYLQPSEYTLMPDGSAQLGQAPTATAEQVHQRLKHPFIDPSVSLASVADAGVFIALVLRYVRAWVFERHGGKIGTNQIRWQLNIGAPSNGLEVARLKAAYERLGCTAWALSQRPAGDMLGSSAILTEAWKPGQLPEGLTDLHVVPEFVAQMAGYVQSPQRLPGLHALIDVGGGTLDVVTFIVHQREDEDVFPFLVPEVRPWGTQMLYQNRLVDAPKYDEKLLPDELLPVLNAADYARQTGLPEIHIRKRDELVLDAVSGIVKAVFHRSKQTRYRLSEAWTKGLRTFLTGGGAKAEGYEEAVISGGQYSAHRINVMTLPLHPKLADFQGAQGEYQRISVACGLAQDAFSLGRIIPAKDVEDDRAGLIQTTRERPDRDELYAR